MSVDVFGRHLKQTEGIQGPPGAGFRFTSDGQYDMEMKKLCNLAVPTDANDAVNLGYLKDIISFEQSMNSEIVKQLRIDLNNLLTQVQNLSTKIDTLAKKSNSTMTQKSRYI